MKKRSLSQRSRNSGKEFPWQNSSVLTPVSSGRKFFFFSQDHFFLHRSRHSGRECAWWTNSLVGQYLHQLSLVQSSRPKFKILSAHADSLLVETLFCYHQFWDDYSMLCRNSINRNIVSFSSVSRKDQSLLHRPRNSGRECAWWTSSLVGQYFHQLSLVQSSRSFQRMQTVH